MQPLRNSLATIHRALECCLLVTLPLWLFPLHALASPADALKQYQSGQYDAALKEYDRLRLQRPEDSRLAFNAGAAAYQAKQFEDATRHFSGATGARDSKLAQSAFYNLGNSQFQLGNAAPDANQKREAWESALGFYDTALKLDPADADAKHNRSFVQRKLEELKQQQDQQQSKDNQDQKKDDKQDDQKKDQQKKDQQKKDDQKQDKSGQDKKQEDKKSDEQKQQKPDGSKPDENKKEENPPKPDQPGEQKQPEQKKPDDQKGQQKQGQQGDQGDKESAQAAALGQMTAQQAMQLLDSQRAEERALIFLPTNATQKASGRVMKNW